ncbi:hypothetical protein [Aeromonas simiae]|uniref:Uncharacterized protein n=1 Tax=Aeromonas simiae TaxID=218936 RepID=A0A5J6WX75_9GAMM|nr:hypothetical protein [Aeromonas simiae]QFI55250.1 hypothetical protein FE240_11470 [Aeromonas simiae]
MRVISDLANGNYFSQGSIFNGLKNSNGLSTLGIIITARCDLEHDKVDKVVCLPIYPLSTWMEIYGNDDFYNKNLKAATTQFDDLATKYELNYETCKTFGIDEFTRILSSRCTKKTDIDKIIQLHDFICNKCKLPKIKNITDSKKRYIESIINNQKQNIHFFEYLEGIEHIGLVVDLSEPISLPIDAAKGISNILFHQKYNRDKDEIYRNILINEDESASFKCIIKSPYIEHLLQRFSQFYARIGTEDISDNVYNEILEVYFAR